MSGSTTTNPWVAEGRILDGRYRILAIIGSGAFGEVFEAEDTLLGCKVAVKIASASAEDASKRMRREAQALSGLGSPHIARLIDAGDVEGRAYVVSELIEGWTLAELLAQDGPLSLSKAIDIGGQVASALQDAHRKGILHRDLKPENVIVGHSGHVWLVDFGVSGELRRETGTTVAGMMFGTPNYMAPEQFLGEEQSSATDLYALGLLLYEMLTGELPFAGASLTERLTSGLRTKLSIPEADLPRPVFEFIQRCLDRDPGKRPADGAVARKLIQDIQDGLGRQESAYAGVAPKPDLGSELARSAPKAWLGWFGVAAVILTVIVLAALFPTSSSGAAMFDPALAALGLLLIITGALLGMWLSRAVARQRNDTETRASDVLAGSKNKEFLNRTLAIEVNALVDSVKRLDERIMARTVALMLNEYQVAKDSDGRKDTLLKSVQLLEKLMDRMTPWYVRYEKLLVFFVTATGVVTGVISIYRSLSP